jgi:hypothetical protein
MRADNYLQPEESDTTTYTADLRVTVTYTLTTQIEAYNEESAKAMIEEDSRALIEKTVLSGEREEVEFDIDYLSDGRD